MRYRAEPIDPRRNGESDIEAGPDRSADAS